MLSCLVAALNSGHNMPRAKPPQVTTNVLNPNRIPKQEIVKKKAQLSSSLGHFSKTVHHWGALVSVLCGVFIIVVITIIFNSIFSVLICPTWIVIYSPLAAVAFCGVMSDVVFG